MIRAALSTALIVLSSAAWAQCADVRGMVCAPGASASLKGDATVYRGKAIERVSGVSVIASGQRVVVADKPGSLALGDTCRVNVPAFSSVTLSSKDGTLCARGVRSFSLNGNVPKSSGASELDRFVGQANRCSEGQVFNTESGRCETGPRVQCPEGTALNLQTGQCVGRGSVFGEQGFLVGGGILTVGAVGAIILANKGKNTVSP